MKKGLLAIISVLISCQAFSQITLGTADFPKSGKTYFLSTALQFSGMDAKATGANYVWDYSQLATTRIGNRADTFLSVSQTATLYSLAFLLNSNHAIAGTNFSLGTFIDVSDAFNFFNNSSSKANYSQTGFGANLNGIPTPVKYNPTDVIYKYPLNFGDMDTSFSSYAITIPGLVYYQVNTTRYNNVDGWGSLTTPYGTFDVLRIKSKLVEVDSVYADSLGFGIKTFPTTRYEYKWLGIGMGEPVLQINTNSFGIVSSIAFLDSISRVGITSDESLTPDFSIYPNPATERVTVHCTLPVAADVSIEVIDINGKAIVSSEKKKQAAGDYLMLLELPQSLAASANYFVRLNWNGKQVVKPLTISK